MTDNDNESIASCDTYEVDDDRNNNGNETVAKNATCGSSRKRARTRTPLGEESRKRKNDRERRRRQRIRDACDDLLRLIPNVERNQQRLLTKEMILEKAVQYLAHLSNCEKNACDDFKPRFDRTPSPLSMNAPTNDQTSKSSLSMIIEKIAVMNQKRKLVDCKQTDANSTTASSDTITTNALAITNGIEDTVLAIEEKKSSSKQSSKSRRNKFAPKFSN